MFAYATSLDILDTYLKTPIYEIVSLILIPFNIFRSISKISKLVIPKLNPYIIVN